MPSGAAAGREGVTQVAPDPARPRPSVIAVTRIRWAPAYRIVPTRHPSVFLFDRVADPEDFDALYALESLTNDRVRDEVGKIEMVPAEDRIFGPGTGPIMAAFTHLNPEGSRFSDGSYGVFYAARERATAIAETRYHHARFLRATGEASMHLPMRLYHVHIDARLHDLRPDGVVDERVHDPDSYQVSRQVGASLRAQGSNGVVYRSARIAQGQCAGLFRPRGARNCVHAAYLLYAWDGSRFSGVYQQTD